VANSPSFEDKAVMEFFETAGRNTHAAEAVAGVGHHVALSVVGTDRMLASSYFRAKLVQENLIKASGIPYTIVRATQFFEFVGSNAEGGASGDTVRLSPALMQPIVSDDVAAILADVAVGKPLNATIDIAGPEPIRMDDLPPIPDRPPRPAQSNNRPERRLLRHSGERRKPNSHRPRPPRPNAFRRMADRAELQR
jgi:uncharacterized protein YbjT (DUF2867 family)